MKIRQIIKYFECSSNKKKITENKFVNKIIEKLIFRYFNIRNF